MTDQEDGAKEVILYAGPATALARFGETAIVRALAPRVQLFHKDFSPEECLALAQACAYHDLDPDPAMNELHAWVDTRNEKVKERDAGGREIEVWRPARKLVIMRGYQGDDSVAAQNLATMGSHAESTTFRLVTDPDERARIGVKDGDLVYEAIVSHYREVQDWVNRRSIMRLDEGMKTEEIDKRLGTTPPGVQGIGVLTKEEIDALNQQKRNKYPHTERCKKRAKKAAMRSAGWLRRPQRMLDVQSLDLSKFSVDADWIKDLGAAVRTPVETRAAGARASESLYPESPRYGPRPWKPGAVKLALEDSTRIHERKNESATDKQRGAAMGTITTIFGGGKAGNEERHHVLHWLFGIESGRDLTGPQILALLDWLKLTPVQTDNGEEKWEPSPFLATELPAIYERWLADQPGQGQMFTEGEYRVPTEEEA